MQFAFILGNLCVETLSLFGLTCQHPGRYVTAVFLEQLWFEFVQSLQCAARVFCCPRRTAEKLLVVEPDRSDASGSFQLLPDRKWWLL